MSKWKPPKTVEVKEREGKQRKFQEKIALIAEYLDEDDFMEAIKDYKPTVEQRIEWTRLFRAYQRQEARAFAFARSTTLSNVARAFSCCSLESCRSCSSSSRQDVQVRTMPLRLM